jgi:cyclohexanone monooxygenase
VYEKAWNEGGGFRFMFETFGDIATDEDTNEEAAKFIRRKTAEIVTDPETARKLTPTDLYARRPLCDSGNYETFNRPIVTLVNVKENPIAKATVKGIVTEDGTLHELDVLPGVLPEPDDRRIPRAPLAGELVELLPRRSLVCSGIDRSQIP